MKLFKKIKFKDEFWCIIKLDEDEKEVIGHEFAVSQKYPGDYWQRNHLNTLEGRLEWLRSIDRPMYYEGYFDTELECYYHIKLVEVCNKLDSIRDALTDVYNMFPASPDSKESIIMRSNAKETNTVHWFGTHLVLDEDSVSCSAGDGIYE